VSFFRPLAFLRFLTAAPRRPAAGLLARGRQPARTRLTVEGLEERALLASALGVAGDYNAFLFGSLTQSYTDAQGRVAAGGDVNLTGYSVGSAVTSSAGLPNALVVGGNLTFNQGQVSGGNVVYGGTATLINVGMGSGTAGQGTPVDFAAAQSDLTAQSASWATLAANGVTTDSYGTVGLAGTDPNLDVFTVSAADLATANGLNISAPAGATVLVNVTGTAGQMQNFGMSVSGTDRQHVLFNFPSATTLVLSGISVEGSVLAPQAAVTFNNGNLDGTLVGLSLIGNGEVHNYPTLAQVNVSAGAPDVTVSKTADQPTVNAGQLAGFTVTVTNAGTATAIGVTLSDPLPAGLGHDISWAIDPATGNPTAFVLAGAVGSQSLSLPANTSLAPGASLLVHITGTTTFADVNSSFTGTLANTATVSAANEAANLQNQQASATVTVVAPAVAVVQTADQATVNAGQTAGFTVKITNQGATTATGVTLADALPAGAGNDVHWVLDTSTGNSTAFQITGAVGHQVLSLQGSTVTLAAGASLTVHLTGLTTTADAPPPALSGTLPSTATVSAANEAPGLQNAKASATVTVVAVPGPVTAGQFATIGSWHNKNGQAVINSFNGGPSATLLGNWLASNFPHLFGASNPYIGSTLAGFGVQTLAGLTNAQVATVYANLWTPNGLPKNTYAQAFAVALGLYADTASLSGPSQAAAYGFKVTAAGAGTFNLGANAAAFPGLGSNPTVMQILKAVDGFFTSATGLFYGGDQTKTGDANNVLNGINTTGDIT
jgi:choice-of-anchor A domain-containing protein/uncharacterized repeat protein (TIGR01451 family)